MGMKCLNTTGGKKPKKGDFLVQGLWKISSVCCTPILSSSPTGWLQPIPAHLTCLYSRFSQLLQHLPFKFPLELTQSFPPQIWILQMKVLYVILSYWPSTVLGLPLLKTPSHQGTLSSFCKNSRMNTKKHLVSSCWQSSFGSIDRKSVV